MTAAVLDGGVAPGKGGITRPHVSVLVDADTVSRDLTDPCAPDPDHPTAAPRIDDARWAELPAGALAWGGKLSPQAVRRICCDAAVSRIVMTGDSQVLDVGRATRNWSGPQRRAVNARDGGCRGPNCSRPVGWTAVHHLVWWRNSGETTVDNGLALCHHCHRLVHDRGWIVHVDTATSEATWTSPAGRTIITTPHRRPHPSRHRGRAGPASSADPAATADPVTPPVSADLTAASDPPATRDLPITASPPAMAGRWTTAHPPPPA